MPQLPKIRINDVRVELFRRSFYEFVKYFWDTIIAEEPVWNWHIEYICDELQKVGERVKARQEKEYDYYIINVPPGSSKSTIVSEMYPLWCWTIDPTQRFICGSYASTVAEDLAEKCFNVYNSDKFRALYPDLVKKQSGGKTHFKNGLRGERFTTSTGSAVTGVHAHQKILDDPMSPAIADSDKERNTANKWVSETLSTRNVSSEITVTIIVMQRLHAHDTTGYILAKPLLKVKHICLPAELSEDVRPVELKEKYVGGLFDPVRLSRQSLGTKLEELGSYGYSGQMAQRPSPLEGGIIKKEWFPIIKASEAPKPLSISFQEDTAYTDKKGNDPSGILAYYKAHGILYITNYITVRKEFPQFCSWMVVHVNQHGYNEYSRIYIEPKANGKSIVQQIKFTTDLNVIEDRAPDTSKVARANACSPKMESGRVVLIEGYWNESFLNQLAAFPNAAHDEEVDTLCAVIDRELIKGGNAGQYEFG